MASTATPANVRVISSWVEGDVTGKRRICKRVEIHNCTFGALVTNICPASALGLSVIEEASMGVLGALGPKAVALAPDFVGGLLLTFLGVNKDEPTAIEAPSSPEGLYCTVKGY